MSHEVQLNHKERERIAAIEKRRDWLKQRIESMPDKAISYDKHELSALTWVLNEIDSLKGLRHEFKMLQSGAERVLEDNIRLKKQIALLRRTAR